MIDFYIYFRCMRLTKYNRRPNNLLPLKRKYVQLRQLKLQNFHFYQNGDLSLKSPQIVLFPGF